MSLTSPALAGGFFTTSATWEAVAKGVGGGGGQGRLNSNKVPHKDLQRFIEKRDCQNNHDEILEALSSHFQIMEFTFDS